MNLSADDALETKQTKGTKGNSDHAQTWLRDALQDGPMPAGDVLKQGNENGFNPKQLRNALEALGGKSAKASFTSGWEWSLPSHPPAREGAEDCHEDSQDSRPAERESWESSAESSPSSDDDEWGEVA